MENLSDIIENSNSDTKNGTSVQQTESLSLDIEKLRSTNVKEIAPKLKWFSLEGKLDDNTRKQLSELLAGTTKLWSLNLVCSNLQKFPLEIGRLTNLGFLNFYNNELTSVPSEIEKLTQLINLGLCRNRLTNLPPEIGKLTNLKVLSLSDNGLTILPAEIGNLTNLEYLDLGFNRLKTLPPEIGKLTNLENLILTKNNFNTLLPEIGKLIHLKKLNLSSNKFTTLPPEIGNLINLTELKLTYIELENLPAEIWNLPNLEHVELDDDLSISICQFIDLNEYIVDGECDYDDIYEMISYEVKQLDLSNKHLVHLPLDIIMCESLMELNISNNELTEVPALLNKLKELRKIDVSGNRKIDSIEKIPNTIFELSNLEKIILSENGQDREYHQDELAKIREQRIKKVIVELKKNRENIVMKYLLFRNTIVVNKDLEESIRQDQETFAKEQFLTSLIGKLKATRDKYNNMLITNE